MINAIIAYVLFLIGGIAYAILSLKNTSSETLIAVYYCDVLLLVMSCVFLIIHILKKGAK